MNDFLALSMRRGGTRRAFIRSTTTKICPNFSKSELLSKRLKTFITRESRRMTGRELLSRTRSLRDNKKKYCEALAQNPFYLKIKRKKGRQHLKAKESDSKYKRKNQKNKKLNKQSVD